MKKMIKKHYAMFDTKAQHFLNTFECINHGDAIRLFTTFVNGDKEKSNISRYPEHFILFYMYDYDDKTGMTGTYNETTQTLEAQKPPQELIIGVAVLEEQRTTYTVKQLITMLKAELGTENVVNIAEGANK